MQHEPGGWPAVALDEAEADMWLTDLRIVLPDGEIQSGSIHVVGERIAAVVPGGATPPLHAPVLVGRGLVAIPGLIDMCGDLLERELEPRPSSLFPIDAALHEFDKRLAGAGVTTCCAVLTLDAPSSSWRSRRAEYVGHIARTIVAQHPDLLTDLRVHLRCYPGLPDAPALADQLLAEGLCDLVGLVGVAGDMAGVAEAAWQHSIPLAVHALASLDEVVQAREMGVGLCLFPVSSEVALAANSHGMTVVSSAPQLLRGGTVGQPLRDLVARGASLVLAADESPIALLQALFALAREGLPLYKAVALATSNPAKALGLTDRGALVPGLLADLVLVEPGPLPRVRMAMRRGVPIYQRM